MKNIILFGPPGSGKGTQSQKIQDTYDLKHISTGDLFRMNIKNNTSLGKKAKSYMDKGNLVPDEVVIDMLKNAVLTSKQAKGFIFDGFPRTVAQADALEVFLNDNNTPLSGLISLEVQDDELIKRLLERGKISGRVDDQGIGKIQNRLKVYSKETSPVKEYFRKKNMLIPIKGEGNIDQIFENIKTAVESLK